MVWNEAWPCCMIYRVEITYFIGEWEIYLLELQWLCQGHRCQGIHQSTLLEFNSRKIKGKKRDRFERKWSDGFEDCTSGSLSSTVGHLQDSQDKDAIDYLFSLNKGVSEKHRKSVKGERVSVSEKERERKRIALSLFCVKQLQHSRRSHSHIYNKASNDWSSSALHLYPGPSSTLIFIACSKDVFLRNATQDF